MTFLRRWVNNCRQPRGQACQTFMLYQWVLATHFVADDETSGEPFAVLVDGGNQRKRGKKSVVADALRKDVSGLTKLDVVICTHKDADHSSGLRTFADDWNGKIGEFWLPGKWSTNVAQLIADPYRTVRDLACATSKVVTKLSKDRASLSVVSEEQPFTLQLITVLKETIERDEGIKETLADDQVWTFSMRIMNHILIAIDWPKHSARVKIGLKN